MTLNFSPLAPFRLSVWSLFNDIAEDRGENILYKRG